MTLKIIKKELYVGQIVKCQNSWGTKYTAEVIDINGNEAFVRRTDNRDGVGPNNEWKVWRNDTGSWDGGCRTVSSYYRYHRYNERTGGSWLYGESITSWKDLLD